MSHSPIDRWHKILKAGDLASLAELLDDNAVFHSPVLHAPQRGKQLTLMYLSAAFKVLVSEKFHYVREIVGDRDAVLEFETEIDGIAINGVDMIRWNDNMKIVDFKVMLRPMKGLQMVQKKMADMLALLPKPKL